MQSDQLSRRLVVILHADVVGSTALVQCNESIAHSRMLANFKTFSEIIHSYAGTTRELRGDALVAHFDRASDAVAAAMAFQIGQAETNRALDDEIRPFFRIGISLGEVVIADGTMTGAGVVVAQRLEQLAEPGGVVVQGAVAESVPTRLPFEFRDLGAMTLKGFTQPVRAFEATLKPGMELPAPDVSIHAESATYPVSKKPSVAVLPFTNMSSDADLEHFCDGLTEDIITAISRIKWQDVVSRNSTFAYKNTSPDIREVADALGADYVLEGSVRKGAGKFRITAQLIDARSGKHIWADRYNRDQLDEFEIQDEVAHRVSSILAERIWQDVAGNIARKQPGEYGPFDYAYLGIELLHHVDPGKSSTAVGYLTKALELEPKMPVVHLGLGFIYLMNHAFWDDPTGSGLELGYRHAKTLEDIAPDNAQTYRLLSRAYTLKRQFDESLRCAERALQISPDDGDIIGNMGLHLLYFGEPERAIEWFDKVLDLHAETPHTVDIMHLWKSIALFMLARYEDSISTLKGISGLEFLKHLLLAACHAMLGSTDKAQSASNVVMTSRPNLRLKDLGICDAFRREEDRNHLRHALLSSGIPA